MEILKTKESESKQELIHNVLTNLELPERAHIQNNQVDLGEKLGLFLIEEGYIKDIETKDSDDDFTFDYDKENKTIFLAQKTMPLDHWRDNVYRKQTDIGEDKTVPLFPMHPAYNTETRKDEIKTYLFLNKIVAAYQEYKKEQESFEYNLPPEQYYESAIKGDIRTPSASLLRLCYEKREISGENEPKSRGLSLSGSLDKFKYEENDDIKERKDEYTFRAIEDMNELITTYLWNPKFFKSYTEYLSSNKKENLYRKQLFKIRPEEAENLRSIILFYTKEMKEEIDYKKNLKYFKQNK